MTDRGRWRWAVIPILLLALLAGGGLVALNVNGLHAAQPASAAVPIATARVIRTDLSSTTTLQGSVDYDGSYTIVAQRPGVVTRQLAPGTVVGRGQALYELDGRSIQLFYGSRPLWRTITRGIAPGPDVVQLDDNLVALGFARAQDMAANGTFGWASQLAVNRWQAWAGQPVTGAIQVGDVAFAPGALRIVSVTALVGGLAQPGAPVLMASGTQKIVSMAVPAARANLVHTGDPVSVTFPDGRTDAGTVSSVSSVATQPSADSRSGGSTDVTVAATVSLSHPDAAGILDQAPVTVQVVEARAAGVLAVPINALVALAEGGFAVRRVDGSLIAVHTGMFSDTLVEVSGLGLREGDRVEVPAS